MKIAIGFVFWAVFFTLGHLYGILAAVCFWVAFTAAWNLLKAKGGPSGEEEIVSSYETGEEMGRRVRDWFKGKDP